MGILPSRRYTLSEWDNSVSIRGGGADKTRPESCTTLIADERDGT
jgi:hypothetical protein